jgi:hypothetical protein
VLNAAILLLFVVIGYYLTLRVLGSRAPLPRQPPLPPVEPLPDDLARDPATRLLLHLAGAEEVGRLRGRSAADPVFAVELSRRRGQLICAYAAGDLPAGFQNAFRASLLPVSGIAQEVEVERALGIMADAAFDKLRTRLTYRQHRIDALWRWLTLPRASTTPEPPSGPCLMVRPAQSEAGPAELEGSVVSTSGELLVVNLGLEHGLGPGDFVQIERGENEWIGTSVVVDAEAGSCHARFMSDAKPRVGDRAVGVLEGDFL